MYFTRSRETKRDALISSDLSFDWRSRVQDVCKIILYATALAFGNRKAMRGVVAAVTDHDKRAAIFLDLRIIFVGVALFYAPESMEYGLQNRWNNHTV